MGKVCTAFVLIVLATATAVPFYIDTDPTFSDISKSFNAILKYFQDI